jgi:hypothetical protein
VKDAVFWDVTPYGSCNNRRFGGTIASIIRVPRIGVLRLLVTAKVVPSSPILVTIMMVAIGSSETSPLITATLRHIPDDGILHSHRREYLNSYIVGVKTILRSCVSSLRGGNDDDDNDDTGGSKPLRWAPALRFT